MPAPRILQAFIPFQIVTRTFDKGRPPIERVLYGLTTLAMIAILVAGIMSKFGGDIAIIDILHYGVLWFFTLIQLSLLVTVAVQYIPQGIKLYPTNRLKAVGYCTLGGISGILGVTIAVVLGYIITQY